MIDKCVFCHNTLNNNKNLQGKNDESYRSEYYLCKCRVCYREDRNSKSLLYFYFFHKGRRIEYNYENGPKYIIMSPHEPKIEVEIQLYSDQYFPLTPENCAQKLSLYLTFS